MSCVAFTTKLYFILSALNVTNPLSYPPSQQPLQLSQPLFPTVVIIPFTVHQNIIDQMDFNLSRSLLSQANLRKASLISIYSKNVQLLMQVRQWHCVGWQTVGLYEKNNSLANALKYTIGSHGTYHHVFSHTTIFVSFVLYL